MPDICTDNRFELIEKYKKELIKGTNIETSQDEMAVLDSLLFRFWQMGWLDRLEQPERKKGKWNTYYHGEEAGRSMFTYSCNQCGYSAPYNLIGGVCEQKKWNFCPNCGADMRGET